MDTNIQEPFAGDLFAPLPTPAETNWRAERLAFYRNHVRPIDILAARFPVPVVWSGRTRSQPWHVVSS